MGDPVSQFSAITGAAAGAAGLDDFLNPDLPEVPELPPPVEEIDVAGQKQYTKKRLKGRKGRASTILSKMGSSNQGKKTVLG